MATPLSAAELLALAETDVSIRLTPEQLQPALAHPPFVNVEGTFNVRDLGRLPREDGTDSGIRPGYVFRSGMLSYLTPKGAATLAGDLGVRRVFDLRSQSEHAAMADPLPAESGVTVVWEETSEATPHLSLDPFAAGYGEQGFADMYLDVLKAYRPAIRALLEHVRDRPQEPFLFHCTAGRDRTGVIAGLLLALAGAPRDVVALDYMLSRVGYEPVRDQLEGFARMGAGVLSTVKVAADEAGGSDDGPAAAAAAAAAPPPGFLNLLSLRVRCWDAFLDALEKEHGGFEGYVTKTLGFAPADVATIKANLTTAPE